MNKIYILEYCVKEAGPVGSHAALIVKQTEWWAAQLLAIFPFKDYWYFIIEGSFIDVDIRGLPDTPAYMRLVDKEYVKRYIDDDKIRRYVNNC